MTRTALVESTTAEAHRLMLLILAASYPDIFDDITGTALNPTYGSET